MSMILMWAINERVNGFRVTSIIFCQQQDKHINKITTSVEMMTIWSAGPAEEETLFLSQAVWNPRHKTLPSLLPLSFTQTQL